MRTIGLSVSARKAAHEPEEDMRLRVMALAASVLATVAVSTVSHVNGPFRSEDAEPVNARQIGDLTVLDAPIGHRQPAKTDLPSWLASWKTLGKQKAESLPREFGKATES
jgi:hypothetical protein